MNRLLPISALLACVLIGCTVDQDKERATYRKVVDTTQPTTAAAATGTPISLRDALLLANQQNERLSIEGESFLQSLIARQRAVANFLPTLNLAPIWTLYDQPQNVNGSSVGRSTVDVIATADANVFNGFSDLARLKSSDQTIEQRRALLIDAQEQLLIDVVQVYYAVLKAERSVEVLDNSLAVQEARVSDIRGRHDAGVARPLDVAQTEALAAATHVALINAQNDVANGRQALAFLTAFPVNSIPLSDTFDPPADVDSAADLQEVAALNRQDLLAAIHSTLAAREQVRAAVGQYYPSVSVDLDYYLMRDNGSGDRGWIGTVQANIPIFSAGRIEADVRDAWSRFRQESYNESLTRRRVDQEVDLVRQNLLTSHERIAEIQVQLTAASEAFRQADQSYNVGLATNLERLTAQDQLLTAQLALAQASFDDKLLYLQLLRATGQLRTMIGIPTAPATQPALALSVDVSRGSK